MEVSRVDTADLAPYLQRFFSRRNGQYVAPRNPSSILRKGVVNRILYYTGSFNPPHAGHLATLKHAVDHCGRGYNVVAVIVEMTHDNTLKRKFEEQPGTLLLSSTQRVQIWGEALRNRHEDGNKDDGQNTCCWIIGGYAFCGWESGFEYEMLRLTSKVLPGFDVRVTHLIGGDYIRPDSRAKSLFSLDDIIVSNISRPVEFQNDLGEMIQMPFCSEWERVLDQGDSNDGAEEYAKLNESGNEQGKEVQPIPCQENEFVR